ncbi:ankyrin repeat domain-containing protein [Chamaesiphon sp. GL140_3_metabinner_50]|uniref:ankyrin repeat domain-containing protein n=1 Tax=Chamaesiphon sp. GL140_3_metabinner_50 TaxID=2970812 RepID=UPI0025F0E7B8|nr:ankyrin repeat domain-containing protein [Chamaesiphon sp. GL140_3_metabinner_50]
MSVDPKTQSLFDAIAAASYERVKFAIDTGVAINSPNQRGQTPLAVACRQGSLEIVDLLVAAGAQMQAPKNSAFQPIVNPVVVIPNSSLTSASTDAATEPLEPHNARQVPFENLIDLIHQPSTNRATEIERVIPVGNLRAPTQIDRLAPDWQDIGSEAEMTYTFDLDEVFTTDRDPNLLANLDSTDMFEHVEITTTDRLSPRDRELDFEASETYAFDLSLNLDRLTTDDAASSDRLSTPMGAWEENETYIVENCDGGISALDLNLSNLPQQQLDRRISDIDRLFEMDESYFTPTETWEDGETYAIDLGDLQPAANAVDVEPSISSESHLLSDLDSSLFPVIGGEDEPEYFVDTQTSTDIFGHSDARLERERELAEPVYEGNATNTSLMAAAIDGDLDLVQQAIEAGANLDRYDWNLGYAPLGMAIERGHLDIVQCLLTAGANAQCGSVSTTALGLAAESGAVEIVQMLLPRGVDLNAPVGRDGWTALLSAIERGHRAVVQLLVAAGANVNVWSRGETPILLAAKCEDREIYHYLYPLVNTTIRLCADRDGEQLLQATRKRRIRAQNRPVEKFIEMATIGNIDEINRAIEIGVEIDELGAKGHTALMAAAYYGHRSLVNILLAAGADPNLLSDDDGLGAGMTALMLAAGSFFASNRQHVLKLLIAGGADVNQRGAGGKTAIFYAALAGAGYADCVETMVAAGADLHLVDDRGHTVLSAVAAAENYPMFNLLMQAGASTLGLESVQLIQAATTGNTDRVQSLVAGNVNLDLDRGAAIGNAAAAGHTKIVELLIRAGANVNLRDKLGFTPIASAAYAGYGEIVQLLIEAGADIQAPAGESQSYSALEYAQMGLYQFERSDLQHAQIVRQLQQLGAR